MKMKSIMKEKKKVVIADKVIITKKKLFIYNGIYDILLLI